MNRAAFKIKRAFKAEFIRVEYDVEKAAHAVEESKLPSEYAEQGILSSLPNVKIVYTP